jgi:hypothetical protein
MSLTGIENKVLSRIFGLKRRNNRRLEKIAQFEDVFPLKLLRAMEQLRNAYRILVGNHEEKIQLGGPRLR